MDINTYRVILRLNPWLEMESAWLDHARDQVPARYINRMVRPELHMDMVTLIIGPRQAGKSTLAWKTVSKSSRPFVFINCEEHLLKKLCSSPALFLDEMEKLAPGSEGFFFEEAQHLAEAGLFLKGLVDLKPGRKIIVTGSSSYHLRARTRESLAGRAVRHVLLPFGVSELGPENAPETVSRMKLRKIWNELLLFGGYPEVYLTRDEDRESILSRLVEALILRDASDLFMIKNPAAFRKLMELAASQAGNLVNYSKLSENTGISVNTVIQYFGILEESHIIRQLSPFAGGKRAEITSRPKIYFLDNGIRNYLFGGFQTLDHRADSGALTENLVFTELCKSIRPLADKIYYWRSKSGAEVDFVLEKQSRIVGVEVKSGSLTKPKISRSLRSFIAAYHPEIVYLVNSSLDHSMDVDGTEVRFIPPYLLHEHLARL